MFNDEIKNQLTKELVVERYKFIQDKQKYLDTILHTNIAFFVKLLVTIFSLIIAGLSFFKQSPEVLDQDSLILLFQLSSLLCGFICSFFLLMTISNVIAWFGYRNDEVDLLESFNSNFKRDRPKKCSFLTWQESWFILALLIFIIVSFSGGMKSAEVITYLVN